MLKNLEKYKVILASNSPRRKELLSGLGICYEVKTLPGIEESYPDTLSGEEIPVFIACEKADAYRQTMHSDELIITADTIVWMVWLWENLKMKRMPGVCFVAFQGKLIK